METSVLIGGTPITNLRFADDIDLMAGSNGELQELTDKLHACSKAYGMEINTKKSKVMVNTIGEEKADIRLDGQSLEEVESFKYLGSLLTKNVRSTDDIRARITLMRLQSLG